MGGLCSTHDRSDEWIKFIGIAEMNTTPRWKDNIKCIIKE